MLIFARLGTAMMLLPGFGELYVPQRYRLLLALMMAGLLMPVIAPVLPPLPASPSQLAVLVLGEVVIGAFIGTVARILVATLETAGMMISLQMGLSAATMFNPLGDQQSSPLPAAFLGVLGVVLIFLNTDLDHLLLRAAVESYGILHAGGIAAARRSQRHHHAARRPASFSRWRSEISAPFLVLGIVFFAALGVVARMVPQLQVLFIAQPLQIMGGLLVFAVVLVVGMRWFLEAFVQQMGFLVGN